MTPAEIAAYATYVGPGWRSIVERALRLLPDSAVMLECKQKMGTLRLYMRWAQRDHARCVRVIGAAERLAARTCERCGAPGELGSDAAGYWMTACPGCRKLERSR